ncbi:hypothetical protein Sjap_010174 [Stephania japonica]|uniref:Secreted protein n=1 Tax=Stephania japonica TaxID=461633 RepID=A0AAP0J8J7_9MAGN
MGVLPIVLKGFVLCVSTIWALQERRFSTVFNAVNSGVTSLVTALTSCFSSVHHQTRGIVIFV